MPPTANPDRTYNFCIETYDDGVAFSELQKSKGFEVFPNPFVNKIVISTNQPGDLSHISVINILGKIVFSSKVQLNQGNNIVPMPDLSPGIYTLLLRNSKGMDYNKKMIRSQSL